MRINEIFYSLQGEGRWTGTPCVFVRFSGCNLRCSFCDTEHESGKEYSVDEVICEVAQYPTMHVVLTGGEPTLQITKELLDRLAKKGKFIHLETNGSNTISDDCIGYINWITVSPKTKPVAIQRMDEMKCVYEGEKTRRQLGFVEAMNIAYFNCDELYLQPCDTKDEAMNKQILEETISYIKEHPIWKLSLQTQKILNVR